MTVVAIVKSRRIVKVLLTLVVIGVSIGLSWYTTLSSLKDPNFIFNSFQRTNTAWLYSDKIGSAAASSIERARVAIGGPLGLSSKEAIYFVAVEDDQGRPLTSSCVYRVHGQPIDARWWSLTLYDSNTQHYVRNEANRSSWNSVAIPRSESGDWIVNVSSISQKIAWLPSQPESGNSFELMLRIYNPSEKTRAAAPNIDLPKIEKISC